uniref:Uncharacterized protein n=1 Tax=Pseudomonas phage HRDY3 TaxID=3236930 RepID=A0AB39CE00_9VIRU
MKELTLDQMRDLVNEAEHKLNGILPEARSYGMKIKATSKFPRTTAMACLESLEEIGRYYTECMDVVKAHRVVFEDAEWRRLHAALLAMGIDPENVN